MIIPEHLEPSPLKKCMSHQMAKKCAGSGLLFMHLQLAFQRDGVHEFYDVLSEEINNKPRVTKNKVVIAKQKNRNK